MSWFVFLFWLGFYGQLFLWKAWCHENITPKDLIFFLGIPKAQTVSQFRGVHNMARANLRNEDKYNLCTFIIFVGCQFLMCFSVIYVIPWSLALIYHEKLAPLNHKTNTHYQLEFQMHLKFFNLTMLNDEKVLL